MKTAKTSHIRSVFLSLEGKPRLEVQRLERLTVDDVVEKEAYLPVERFDPTKLGKKERTVLEGVMGEVMPQLTARITELEGEVEGLKAEATEDAKAHAAQLDALQAQANEQAQAQSVRVAELEAFLDEAERRLAELMVTGEAG